MLENLVWNSLTAFLVEVSGYKLEQPSCLHSTKCYSSINWIYLFRKFFFRDFQNQRRVCLNPPLEGIVKSMEQKTCDSCSIYVQELHLGRRNSSLMKHFILLVQRKKGWPQVCAGVTVFCTIRHELVYSLMWRRKCGPKGPPPWENGGISGRRCRMRSSMVIYSRCCC